MDALKKDVAEHPDSYISERADHFGVSDSGMYYALQRLGVTYKKSLSHSRACPAARRSFPEGDLKI